MAEYPIPSLFVDDVVATAATQRPALVNRNPGPDETGVPYDQTIALELVDPEADGVDRNATRVWVDGTLAFEGGAVPEVKPGFDGASAEILEVGADTLRITLHPTTPFSSEQLVAVRVASAVVGGASSIDETYSFTVEDIAAPLVESALAFEQRKVRIEFDEAVEVTDPAGFAFEAQSAPAVPIVPIEAEADGTAVVVTTDVEMTPDVVYSIVVTGVSDTDGNPVQAPNDTAEFAGFRPARPDARRFDIWTQCIPLHNRREDTSGDLRRFVDCIQEVVDLLLAGIDAFSDIWDLERTPFIDALLADLGNPFAFDLEEIDKRRLASVLVRMYRQKGTDVGIVNAVRFFLGIEITVEAWNLQTMQLGVSQLGVDWTLGPSDSRSRYSFDLSTDEVLTTVQTRQIRMLAEYIKPAHTHLVTIQDGSATPTDPLWVLGESQLGVDTTLA